MNSFAKNITLTICLFFLATALNAQQKNTGPHGGRLKTTGNYKIEILGCDNYIEVYLYDEDTNAISNNDINGNIEFYYSQQATLVGMLVRYGMDGFTAKIPINTFLYSRPTLNISGKIVVTEKFENQCLSLNKN